MDGVLADLTPRLVEFHNFTYKTTFKIVDYANYELSEVWQCSIEQKIKRIHQFYNSPYFKKITPLLDALPRVKYLSRKHSLILVTSRPHFIETSSQAWLNKYFPQQFSKIIHTNQITQKHEQKKSKSEICEEEKIEVMIEDALEYAIDCANKGIKVLLLNTVWNQKEKLPKNIKRVFNWEEIIRAI